MQAVLSEEKRAANDSLGMEGNGLENGYFLGWIWRVAENKSGQEVKKIYHFLFPNNKRKTSFIQTRCTQQKFVSFVRVRQENMTDQKVSWVRRSHRGKVTVK